MYSISTFHQSVPGDLSLFCLSKGEHLDWFVSGRKAKRFVKPLDGGYHIPKFCQQFWEECWSLGFSFFAMYLVCLILNVAKFTTATRAIWRIGATWKQQTILKYPAYKKCYNILNNQLAENRGVCCSAGKGSFTRNKPIAPLCIMTEWDFAAGYFFGNCGFKLALIYMYWK